MKKTGKWKAAFLITSVLILVLTFEGCEFLDDVQSETNLSSTSESSNTLIPNDDGGNISDGDEVSANSTEQVESDKSEIMDVTPQIFKNVSIAHQAWDHTIDAQVDESHPDPEGGEPYVTVRSDSQGIVREIQFAVQQKYYGNGNTMSLDEAVAFIRQYIDTDYLNSHYTFNSSFGIRDFMGYGDDKYYIVYDPDQSEQYGQFYVMIRFTSNKVRHVTAENEGINPYNYELGQMGIDNVKADSLIQWDKKL